MADPFVTKDNAKIARWYFVDETSAAVDTAFDPAPPALIGALMIPGKTREFIFTGKIQEFNEFEQITQFYFNEGISAEVLRLMTAQDALERVPVAVLAARKPEDVPNAKYGDWHSPLRFRGTVTPAPLPLRVFDQSRVPDLP